MSDFRDFYLDNDKCPVCNTSATYKLPDGGFACKCSYEFETNSHEHAENDTKVINFDNNSTESA